MSQDDGLWDYFHEWVGRQGAVRLLNTYRGLPIIQSAVAQSVSRGYVAFEVHPHQVVCMHLEGKTHLIADNIPHILQARVVAVQALRSQAVLAEFRQANGSMGKRLAVRVQPGEPVEVGLYDGERRIPARLIDISLTGISVSGLNPSAVLPNWGSGQGLMIEMKLPPSNGIVHMRGKVIHRMPPPGNPPLRLGIAFVPDPARRQQLEGYINLRQREILDELNRVYQAMCR